MKIILSLLMVAFFASSTPSADQAEWDKVPDILKRIVAPEFPAKDFKITDYGAVAEGKNSTLTSPRRVAFGDPALSQRERERSDCTEAIAKAIKACSEAGGGRVVIPAGEFFTGPIHLVSHVNLHLDKDAVLKFSTDPKAYLPVVFTRFEGTELYNYSPLIYAIDQENIAVTGEGTLDGQADQSNWWAMKKSREDRAKLVKMAADNVPVEQRKFGDGSTLRPSFIEFCRCKNVLIEGVKIRRSPMWELHPLLSTNVTIRGVDIETHGANNDGCDPECCKDVLIENCTFDTGDDCIAIKSGRNSEGRRVGVPTENIIIRNCTMRDGHAGVAIGSEISGDCRNVFVENCEMSSPNLICALRLKSNATRGGVVENIFMRNCNVGIVKDSVLQIDFLYEEGIKGDYKPVAKNVAMDNITVAHTPRVLNVRGFPAAEISNVRIYNSTFKDVQKPDVVQDADVKLVDCKLEPAK